METDAEGTGKCKCIQILGAVEQRDKIHSFNVPTYHHNLLLDTLRLIRGALFQSHLDPFIETNPYSPFARGTLFHFSWILEEKGVYKHHYQGYAPYISSQPLLMEHLPAKYGREAFSHLMANKSQRISAISSLLEDSGIQPEPSSECWFRIGEWLYRHLEVSMEWENQEQPRMHDKVNTGSFMFRPLCYSLLIDLSLLLGEHVIAVRPVCRWYFWDDAKMVNPHSFGREPWVLCEQPPSSGQWDHHPDRFIPFDLLKGIGKNMLRDRLTEARKKAFDLGELFSGLIAPPESQSTSVPEDSEVADLCVWLDDYLHEQVDKRNDTDCQGTLDTFLHQYVDAHGFLPNKHDLDILQNKFGTLPDWVK